MTEPAITVAAGAAATAATAAGAHAFGLPPQDVIVWALLGGLASVWLTGALKGDVTWRKAGEVLVQLIVSASAGIALCYLLLHMAATVPTLAALNHAPEWALTGVLAGIVLQIGPWVVRAAGRVFGNRFGGGDAT